MQSVALTLFRAHSDILEDIASHKDCVPVAKLVNDLDEQVDATVTLLNRQEAELFAEANLKRSIAFFKQ